MWDNVSYQKRETNVRVMVEGDRRIPHLTGIMFWKRQKVWQIQNSQGDFNIYLLCPFINADFSFFPQCPHFQCPSLFPTKDLLITQKGFSSESCEKACSLLFSWWLVPSYRLYSRLLWRYAALPILHSKPTELSSLALSIWIPCPFVLIPLWIPSQISVRMCLLHICAVSPSTVGEDCTITVQRAIANPWSPTLASPLALPKPLPFSDYSKKNCQIPSQSLSTSFSADSPTEPRIIRHKSARSYCGYCPDIHGQALAFSGWTSTTSQNTNIGQGHPVPVKDQDKKNISHYHV